jgi:hypothetical protein
MARQPKPAEPTPKEIGTSKNSSKNSSKNGVTSTNDDGSKDDVEQLSNRNNVFDGDEFDVNTRSAVDR